MSRTTTRTGAVLLTAMLAAAALACSSPAEADADLDEVIASHVGSLSSDGPYRDPRKAEREATRKALSGLLTSTEDTAGPDELLAGIGFRVTHGVDAADGRRFTLYLAEGDTGWGGLLVGRTAPIRSVVEVPHPGFDLHTEKLGLGLYRALPGSMLLIAGAHREAAGGKGDVAHNGRSLFQVISEVFAERGVPQLQLHGFAQRSLPTADAVVSTGAGPHNDHAVRIAGELEAADLRVCRAWVTRCVGLEGNTNVQAAAAAEHDADFVHLELAWSLRADEKSRDMVRDALATAWN